MNWYRATTHVAVLVCGLASQVQADLFEYKDGRVVYGELVGEPVRQEIDGQSETVLTVQTQPGVYVQILRSELSQHERLSQSRQEYAVVAPKVPATVEAQRTLAAECERNGLMDLASAHRLFTVDIAPDDNAVRTAAGFKKDVNGRWATAEEIMAGQRGKVKVAGRWRFPESIAFEQAADGRKQAVAAATKDLLRWHATVTSRTVKANSRRYQEAVVGLQQLDDPLTVGTVVGYLQDTKRELAQPLRLLYVRHLAKFQTFDSAAALSHLSVVDPDPLIRNTCMDALQNFGRPVAIGTYASYLSNANNELINRAAEGLAEMRADTALLPLIGALVTKHTVPVGNGAGMNLSTQGGMSMGGPQEMEVTLENSSVRGALNQLSGEDYGYNKANWLTWYANRYASPVQDLRRDL